MNVQELVNRLLNAKPTDEVVISIGNITNKDVKITDVKFTQEKEKIFVKLPEIPINYFD